MFQVSYRDEGNYSLSLQLSGGDISVLQFQIKVRLYPFNSGAVIGITIGILAIFVIGFAIWVYSMRNKKAEKATNGTRRCIAMMCLMMCSVKHSNFSRGSLQLRCPSGRIVCCWS